VERDVENTRLVEIVRQGAGERLDQVVAPVLPELDVEDVNLEHVAGLGAFDGDRAGKDMARYHAFALRMNVEELGRDMEFVAVRHHVRSPRHRVDGNFITALDRQDRLQLRLEKTPVAGFRAGMQVMMGHEFLAPGLYQCVIAGSDPAIHRSQREYL